MANMTLTPEDLTRDAVADMERCSTFHQQVEFNLKAYHDQDNYSGTGFPEFMLESPLVAEAWIRRAVVAETEVKELKNVLKESVGVSWRECPICGMSWPHPSVRSELRCSDCRNREEKEKLRSEVIRLQNLIENHDTISPCACCGKKLAWVFAGDGTYNHEVDTGNPHSCPISMDDFRDGKFPEGTYRYQEHRAIKAEARIKQLENTCNEAIAMLQTQLESRKP